MTVESLAHEWVTAWCARCGEHQEGRNANGSCPGWVVDRVDITDEMVERAAEELCVLLNGEDSWPVTWEGVEADTGAPVYPHEIAEILRKQARAIVAAALSRERSS